MAAIRFYAAVQQREIDLLHFAARELFGKMAVCGIGARDQDDAAGEAIEAMNDARTQRTAHAR